MAEVMLALVRTFANLRSGRVWLYLLTPALFSLLLTIGLAVWAKARVVCRATISPAVARAVRKDRRSAPIMRPTITSRMTHPAMPLTVAGKAGRPPTITGHRTRVTARARERRMRGET